MTVLATYNIKGGVGKTSAAVNLAYLAAREGSQTLLWDLDPQAASTFLFRVRPKVRGGANALVRLRSDIAGLIRGTDHERLDLLPADFSYRHLDLALDSFKRPTVRLGRVLEAVRDDYEYIFLDCPPSISLVSESVFEAADAVLVPIIPATLSARTFDQLEELHAVADGRVQVFAFFSMVDRAKPLHRAVMARVRAAHPGSVLGAVIPDSEDVEQMGDERDPIGAFAPASMAAISYEALWWDIRRRLRAAAAAAGSGAAPAPAPPAAPAPAPPAPELVSPTPEPASPAPELVSPTPEPAPPPPEPAPEPARPSPEPAPPPA